MPAWLEVNGSRFPVNASCAVGRLPENHVVLDGARVSRRHALIHAHGGGGHWLIDFGSSNGSQLNSRRVFEPTRLQDKDQIEIAGHKLVFHEGRDPTRPNPRHNLNAWKATERNAPAFAATNHGAILLDPDGNVTTITPQARAWLVAYFKPAPAKGDRLPEKLRAWLLEQTAAPKKNTTPGLAADLIIASDEHKRLVVHLAERNSAQRLLLLTEEQSVFAKEMLQTLGLTERESEVLHWLAEGKSNPEIGIILCASPRTIGKHVEHIFQKLGVETRTAALLYVVEKLTRTLS